MPPEKQKTAVHASDGPARSLVAKARQCISDFNMLSSGDRVLAGVSGGPDSVALIHILAELAPLLDIELGIAHFDHGLRPESAAEEIKWVTDLASRLGLAFYPGRLDSKRGQGSLEAWLREQRYQFLERIAQKGGFSKIALGHQANDNAEAVLMHLLRGSGIRGISGIPPVRDNRIIRPLIRANRKEIIDHLNGLGIEWLTDPSNEDMQFERNRIRHQLIPLLEREYSANVVQILNRTASLFFEEDRWIDMQLEPILKKSIDCIDSNTMILEIARLAPHDRPAQRRLLRSAVQRWQGHLQRFGASHIEQLIALLPENKLDRSLHLPGRITVRRTAEGLIFSRAMADTSGRVQAPPNPDKPNFRYLIKEAEALPTTLIVGEAGVQLSFTLSSAEALATVRSGDPDQAVFDLARLDFPLIVRNPEPGDRMAPFGLSGTQKLKKLFIDRKISKAARCRIPVLTSGGTILWTVGVRRSSVAAIDQHTEQVVHVVAKPLSGLNKTES